MVGPSNWVGAFLEFAQRVTLRGFHRGFLYGGVLQGRGVFLQFFSPQLFLSLTGKKFLNFILVRH